MVVRVLHPPFNVGGRTGRPHRHVTVSGTVHSGAAPLFDISRVTVSGTVHSGAAPLFDISRVNVSGTVHSGASPLFDISRVRPQ